MVTRLIHQEWAARLLLILLLTGVPLVLLGAYWIGQDDGVLIHASRPEAGGWTPASLTAQVGEPLHLRLTADDMMHGFAIGRTDFPAVDVPPGKMTEVTVTFDEPGIYTYYCTRWCGANHWRMRGTIDVNGEQSVMPEPVNPPAYVTLQIDIDAPLPEIELTLTRPPSATLGMVYAEQIPADYLTSEITLGQSPYAVWQQLRAEPAFAALEEVQVWDTVAYLWQKETTADTVTVGTQLYAANCAACHGVDGAGDGIVAAIQPTAVPDFTDPTTMLALSTARLEGKIVRGGMGTGMPNWGMIFSDADTQALVDFLWSLQFPMEKIEE